MEGKTQRYVIKIKFNKKDDERGENMGIGKRPKEGQTIRELEEIIRLRDREIHDIKTECAEQFRIIRDYCTCNDYNGQLDRINKIHEVADNNFMALLKDLVDEEERAKIIELPTNHQVSK